MCLAPGDLERALLVDFRELDGGVFRGEDLEKIGTVHTHDEGTFLALAAETDETLLSGIQRNIRDSDC